MSITQIKKQIMSLTFYEP